MRYASVAVLVGMLCVGACKKTTPSAPVVTPPRLAVLVVIDQLRGDEIATYGALWHYGFKRLRDEGRWYKNAMHTHGRTETAAGHATLGTGELPKWHGVVDKHIYVEAQSRDLGVCEFGPLPCDPQVEMAPTMGDRLKTLSPNSRVVALSEKARSASLLGGHNADLVAWTSDSDIELLGRTHGPPGESALPPWLFQFFGRVASPQQIARIWELPRLPEPFASRLDAGDGELDCGHGLTFPHHLTATSGAELASQWHCTPDSDRVIAETALFVARHLELGTRDTPDLLLVSLSATDVIGHNYGYESLERVAVLTELDRQLGDLIDGLEHLVGPHLLIGLSADHGVAPRVSTARAEGHDSARIPLTELTGRVDAALQKEFGPGAYIANFEFRF